MALAVAAAWAGAPAKMERAADSTINRLILSDKAAQRLGIRTGPVVERVVPRTLTVGGTIMSRPGSAARLRAPFAGTVEPAFRSQRLPGPGTQVRAGQTLLRLRPVVAPDRNLLAETQRDLEQAQARFETAQKALVRARRLLNDGATDQAAVELAEQNEAVAQAELLAAQERLRLAKRNPLGADVSLPLRAPQAGVVLALTTAPGQTVAAGAVLIEVVNPNSLWVRVPLYVGRIDEVDRGGPAIVRGLGRTSASTVAVPVPAMPVASVDGTVGDLYYELPAQAPFRAGHRVMVQLRLRNSRRAVRVVPATAVFYDQHGAAWVYTVVAARTYERRRVEVKTVVDGQAILHEGPTVGTPVVRVGTMELYGTEFGIGK